MKRFSSRLLVARRIAGFSLQELSDAMDSSVTRQSLSLYERGETEPRSRTLDALASALDIPKEYFSMETDCISPTCLKADIPDVLSSDEMMQLEDTVLYLTVRRRKKEEVTGNRRKFKISLRGSFLYNTETAADTALWLRSEWGLGEGPIHSVLRSLEANGIYVFDAPLPGNLLAAGTWLNDSRPVLVLDLSKRTATTERIRFIALTELARLLFKVPRGASAREVQGDFARYFLMPHKTLPVELGPARKSVTREEIKILCEYYGVTFESLIVLLAHSGIINDDGDGFWKGLWKTASSISYQYTTFEETLWRDRQLELLCGKH